jgi:hypothetical protein
LRRDTGQRLRVGLRAIYDWFERNAKLMACVLRDAEHNKLTKEINEIRAGATMSSYQDVLGAKLNTRQRAILHLAVSFFTWRTLVLEAGLNQSAAVAVMVQAINSGKN